jgi:anaerobic selenocysteine-containing dehydrogenase
MDPRGTAMMRHATHMLQFKPGRDVAMLNAMLHTIVEEQLYDRQYVQANTEDFEKLVENVRDYAPETMAEIAASPPRPCARWRASTPAPRPRSSSGAWASASTSTAPTTPAA